MHFEGITAETLYKTTDYRYPEHERVICWNDPTLNIHWPLQRPPVLAAKDCAGTLLADADVYDSCQCFFD